MWPPGGAGTPKPRFAGIFPNPAVKSLPKSKVQLRPEQEVRQGLPDSKSTPAGIPEHAQLIEVLVNLLYWAGSPPLKVKGGGCGWHEAPKSWWLLALSGVRVMRTGVLDAECA